MRNIKYLIMGTLFGVIFYKSEVISWFRIQEMFRFQALHMYGVIGSAVLVGALSIYLIKKFNVKSLNGELIEIYHIVREDNSRIDSLSVFLQPRLLDLLLNVFNDPASYTCSETALAYPSATPIM